MYHQILYYRIPSFLFYFLKSPKILCYWLYCLITKKDVKEYFETLRIINELRKICRAHGEMDKKGNWNIKCEYKKRTYGMGVRVRFFKKGTETVYDNFKWDVSQFALKTSTYDYKKGWAYFYLYVVPEPIKEVKTDYHQISIGTGTDGILMWNFDVYSCCLIAGKPRNGKTTEMMYILNGLVQANYDIWLIDGKVVDYFLERKHFKYYVQNKDLKEVCEFIESFHKAMEKRYKQMEELNVNNYNKTDMDPVFLVCDEYLSVIDRAKKEMKKAEFEYLIYLLGDIIRRGPASGYQIILTMQRPDTTYIVGEMRDNIQLKIVLGNGSEELYKMMFNDSKLKRLERGRAWYQQGDNPMEMSIPFYETIERFNKETDINASQAENELVTNQKGNMQ